MAVSAEEFVRIWQAASNIDEVVAQTGASKSAVLHRVYLYRKHGVPLKRFLRGRTANDYQALAKLAKECEQGIRQPRKPAVRKRGRKPKEASSAANG